MPFAAKILDEPIAFFEEVVYNVSNKSAVCGKNINCITEPLDFSWSICYNTVNISAVCGKKLSGGYVLPPAPGKAGIILP